MAVDNPSIAHVLKLSASATIGATINLGNYESLRYEIGVEASRKLSPKEERRAQRLMDQLFNMVDGHVSEKIIDIQRTIKFDSKSRFAVTIKRSKKRSGQED